MSIYVLSVALLFLALLLYAAAPREAARGADRAIRHGADVSREALAAELTRRLQVSAVGAALGTVSGTVMLLVGVQSDAARGPDAIADLAVLLSATVVASVVSEAVNVIRRAPTPAGPRTASLEPRSAHSSPLERAGEIALTVLAVVSAVIATVALSRGIDGVTGTVAAAVGALVVIAVCAATRAQMVRRGVVASDAGAVAVDVVAGTASAHRFGENLVASGGLLTLCSLLVPALAAGPGGLRTAAVTCGAATLVVMAVLVSVRRTVSTQAAA